MPDLAKKYEDILEVVAEALDQLDGFNVPLAYGGLALVVAGIRRIEDDEDLAEATDCYREVATLLKASVERRTGIGAHAN